METATLNRPKNRQRQIVLNVPSQKYNLMMETLRNFDFVKVVEEDEGDSREDIIANLKEAAQSLKLIKEGKLKTRPLKEFLDEL
jgi:Ni,Fe-hydrogenase III large subunit